MSSTKRHRRIGEGHRRAPGDIVTGKHWTVGGDFIGRVCDDAKEAQTICENHLQIMGADMEDAA